MKPPTEMLVLGARDFESQGVPPRDDAAARELVAASPLTLAVVARFDAIAQNALGWCRLEARGPDVWAVGFAQLVRCPCANDSRRFDASK